MQDSGGLILGRIRLLHCKGRGHQRMVLREEDMRFSKDRCHNLIDFFWSAQNVSMKHEHCFLLTNISFTLLFLCYFVRTNRHHCTLNQQLYRDYKKWRGAVAHPDSLNNSPIRLMKWIRNLLCKVRRASSIRDSLLDLKASLSNDCAIWRSIALSSSGELESCVLCCWFCNHKTSL